jgi:hypothetical protein
MKSSSRRQRASDPLASEGEVLRILSMLKERFDEFKSLPERNLVPVVRAARHLHRYPASATRRGRPSRWPRETLLAVGSRLEDILDRETSGRVSFGSFVDHYLNVLLIPKEVCEALKNGRINLFEAEQLGRVTAKRLAVSEGEAARLRLRLMESHLSARLSGNSLRRRINDLFGQPVNAEVASASGQLEEYNLRDDDGDFDPYDSTHLFWEQIKELGFAFREIKREDLSEIDIEELLVATEPVLNLLRKIKRRKGGITPVKLTV